MVELVIGVLGLQGAIEDHESSIKKAAERLGVNISVKRVILPDEIYEVDGLIMPGGESTAMILIGRKNGMLDAVKNRIRDGMPAFGTCAGAILLSKEVRKTETSPLKEGAFPILNIETIRNGYGRQKESFSTKLSIHGEDFHGVFIRAPIFGKIGDGVEVMGEIEGDPVFIKQGNIFATTFHPELANDTRIHEMFLQSIINKN